ncbi:hypothetical protein EJ02DRAFT_59188 [Clathrospora elynae]|uniref:Uncharacterized protein n=1 Tax=Clathrospora elynae TaxID=706981 RepID=A0A6A5SZP1_9PLEO|nr:hypothetical protein EJ02DRAFT_59188 [Clathrospora elynae]
MTGDRKSSDIPSRLGVKRGAKLISKSSKPSSSIIVTPPKAAVVELDDLRLRLHAAEKESQERLQQLLSLKSSVSSLTRADSQITDSELTDSFSQLANRIREWTISNFRRTKLNLNNLPKETVEALASITPDYERAAATDRLGLYQAIVSSAVTQILQEPLVVGLPNTGPLVVVRQCAQVIQGSKPGSEYHEWRRVTIRAIEKGEEIHDLLLKGRDDALHRLAAHVGYLLFTLISENLTSGAQSTLLSILNTAADLQRTLALQKARYQTLFFNGREDNTFSFDDRRMESVNDMDDGMDEDGDTLAERVLLFCVFPCLEKYGDEWGGHLETSNILLKARVCCGFG